MGSETQQLGAPVLCQDQQLSAQLHVRTTWRCFPESVDALTCPPENLMKVVWGRPQIPEFLKTKQNTPGDSNVLPELREDVEDRWVPCASWFLVWPSTGTTRMGGVSLWTPPGSLMEHRGDGHPSWDSSSSAPHLLSP